MTEKLRLDKLLSHMGLGSRKDVRTFMKQGLVTVNGQTIKKPEYPIDPTIDRITCCGKNVFYEPFTYLMMNKPAGYVSATEDAHDPTVMTLLPDPYAHMELFIAGRLDKDTEGFLLITNDGAFAHNILAPQKHVPKTYYAQIDAPLDNRAIQAFAHGLTLSDGTTCRPAKLHILKAGNPSEITLTITEGKFHQIKRMFETLGNNVLYLKRTHIGRLALDDTLAPGQIKKLTAADLALLSAPF